MFSDIVGSLVVLFVEVNYFSLVFFFWGSRRKEIDVKFLYKVKCFWRKGVRVKLVVKMR